MHWQKSKLFFSAGFKRSIRKLLLPKQHLMRLSLALITSLSLISIFPPMCFSTIIAYPKNIAEMTESSDVVVKAKVISTEPVKSKTELDSDWWVVNSARLKVISVLKATNGLQPGKDVTFLYRSDVAPKNTPKMWINVGAGNFAHFNLRPGATYILFAKIGKDSNLRQLSTNYTMREWDGFFRSADDAALGKNVKAADAIWSDLTTFLKASKSDATYARNMMLELSSGQDSSMVGTEDFARAKVLKSIFASSGSNKFDDKDLKELLELVGSASPFANEGYIMRYFWSKAKNPQEMWSPWEKKSNTLDENSLNFLIETANGNTSAELRALAVGSMGQCQNCPDLAKRIKSQVPLWLASPVAEIRACAVLLATDYPDCLTREQLLKLFDDPSEKVRSNAALAIGILQNESLMSKLESMLHDKSSLVQGAAALSLLCLPADRAKTILKAHFSDPEFGLAFVARVASTDPAAYRDLLLKTINANKPAQGASGKCLFFHNGLATDSFGLCVSMMFKYLEDLSGIELRKKDKEVYLDCAEKAAIELNRPNDIYTTLLTHGLPERAEAFKKKFIAAHGEIYAANFKSVDNNFKVGYPPRK
ncbi:MAG: HEAT repeat domain-containing protein [Candidatus Obscuribacterales bacterium]|nr:HEAT repeat domain-containing protein [Candidatus Obscuribacterales bacterium]